MSCLANACVRSPISWLRTQHRTLTLGILAGSSVLIFVQFLLNRGGREVWLLGAPLAISVLGILLTWRRLLPDQIYFGYLCAFLIIGSTCRAFQVAQIEDMVIRIRSMGMQNIIFKGFPIILGLPNKHLFLCVLLMCLGDSAAQFWLSAINSKATAAETATGHYMAIVYFGVTACGIGVAKNILLRRLYDTQIQLEVENEGIETLFSSVGDFVIWLDKDGGKIHRSHFRFDSMLGRKMESEQFSSCLSNAEEKLRYENYMRSVGTGQGSAPAPVMKLSLRLNAAKGSVVDMDFFIVDRRATRHPTTDQEGSFGFLLGGCFTKDHPSFSPLAGSNNNDNNSNNNNNNDNTSLPASDGAAELAAMTSFELMLELPQIDAIREEPSDGENSGEELALELQTAERPNQGRPGPTPSVAPSMASRMSSLPGTEVMFEALSQAVEGDVDKDVLWQIASLGVAEHWLIAVGRVAFPSGDALKILGDGGFGVVLEAHICGTKVAVKTPREGHMHGSALRSMANELRVLRHVRHPNIVLFFGAVIHPDSHVLYRARSLRSASRGWEAWQPGSLADPRGSGQGLAIPARAADAACGSWGCEAQQYHGGVLENRAQG
ncbi:unnamed protein product [Polarella glacialis]|uniref:Protein kinase domain-containing protein n=1 Tax=Polarella glacialis TaxID=89957 RepID=A0A813L3Y9_POLGL|nr:unnamed protein product [Polarella glacialis]